MLNFMNIDEKEFEEICMQILEKKTNKTFRVFGKGRDGGIDIQANENRNIIGQVKLYLQTPQTQAVTNIKKEINRIKNKNIERYYIFIGREMSPQNIEEIYQEAKDIMKSKEDIYTLTEINKLLSSEEYAEIVQKHIKLWLSQTSILEQINNRNIFIDCETLLDNIKEETKLFIPTNIYEICKKILDKDRLLLILGMPGIGKTMTSKMLVLNYANKGYCIRYSNSRNLEELKKSISLNENKKELIFIDDCLGQRYLELCEKDENEIINLIKYIKNKPNKMLLLNSRITIFQEAKNRNYEMGKCIDKGNFQIKVVDLEDISEIEKARILHQYLVVKKIPKEYIEEIKKDKNYIRIIEDTNFSLRIIDYMTEKRIYTKIKPKDYVDAIKDAFQKSIFVWKDEFENRIELVDRILLITLYSIESYLTKEEELKEAFYKRLELENIDTSIQIYEKVIERLNQSFIKKVIKNNEVYIKVINPSVNDFIEEELKNNTAERDKIKKSAIFINQIQNISNSKEEYLEIVKEKIEKNEFLKYKVAHIYNQDIKIEEIFLAHIAFLKDCQPNILDKVMQIDFIKTLLNMKEHGYMIYGYYVTYTNILLTLLSNADMKEKIEKEIYTKGENIVSVIKHTYLEEQAELLEDIYSTLAEKGQKIENEEILIQYLKEEFKKEVSNSSYEFIAEENGYEEIVGNEAYELNNSDEIEEKLEELQELKNTELKINKAIEIEKEFKQELEKNVEEAFIERTMEIIQEELSQICIKLPDTLYEAIKWPEVKKEDINVNKMKELAKKYIYYVYNTMDEDYTFYRKYIYDPQLIEKQEKDRIEYEKELESIFKD